MKVSIAGILPKAIGLGRGELKQAARFFAERSSARIRRSFGEVTVILQNDAQSAEVHLAINGVEGATDVVTQPYDAMPGEADGIYGEVYVNTSRALSVAEHGRWSTGQELLLYVAHGMDHLSGADDLLPDDYARMRRRELAWIRQWQCRR